MMCKKLDYTGHLRRGWGQEGKDEGLVCDLNTNPIKLESLTLAHVSRRVDRKVATRKLKFC